MHCKYLLHYSHGTHTWSVASCSAKNTPYVPSLGEVERFCQSGKHIVCPAYLFSFEAESLARESRIPSGSSSMQNKPGVEPTLVSPAAISAIVFTRCAQVDKTSAIFDAKASTP